ncbi:hypothetical protein PAXRUDRAFT_638409 [Paxillus rubicundulus Ve08.2h10]|uniref:Uncharacterized protein n=1 Tax=Paxillus rubicundulus Ve08.2h10 TaxID=930991 RepID=A0A0D0DXU2_9AGAM|nr:hypothetical protein PAXRUDRAFT_638409 [Paxillus rubicundulus Ve08.2h10]
MLTLLSFSPPKFSVECAIALGIPLLGLQISQNGRKGKRRLLTNCLPPQFYLHHLHLLGCFSEFCLAILNSHPWLRLWSVWPPVSLPQCHILCCASQLCSSAAYSSSISLSCLYQVSFSAYPNLHFCLSLIFPILYLVSHFSYLDKHLTYLRISPSDSFHFDSL